MQMLQSLQKAYGTLLQLRDEMAVARLSAPAPVLRSRDDFPLWLNILNLRGEGAEIGTQRASFSSFLLSHWGGRRLHSIDPWRNFDTGEYVDTANVAGDIQEANFRTAGDRLRPFGERSSIHRKTSTEAAPSFPDGSLDFVYIDAQHHYEAVVEDIETWFPKVRVGGVVAGHDYLDGMVNGTLFGVKRAADEFAASKGFRLVASLELDYPSWFCIKTSN